MQFLDRPLELARSSEHRTTSSACKGMPMEVVKELLGRFCKHEDDRSSHALAASFSSRAAPWTFQSIPRLNERRMTLRGFGLTWTYTTSCPSMALWCTYRAPTPPQLPSIFLFSRSILLRVHFPRLVQCIRPRIRSTNGDFAEALRRSRWERATKMPGRNNVEEGGENIGEYAGARLH